MVVCKYFLQGTCKFGSYCHYDHQQPNNYTSFQNNNGVSTSILRQPSFKQPNRTNVFNTPSNSVGSTVYPPLSGSNMLDANTLKIVLNDMTTAEKGRQWKLSCYGPLGEKPCLPGFEDYSFEEIRSLYYEARNAGNLEQFKQQWSSLLHDASNKMKTVTTSPQVNIFAPQTSSSTTVFNTPSNTNSIFGGSVQNNTFSSQNSIFGGNSNSNGFQTSVFGPSANPVNHSNSIFGPAAPTTQQSIFGNTTSAIQPQPNVFAAPTTASSNNIFNNAPQTQTNVFNNTARISQSIFSNATSNIFGNATPATPSTIFGNTPPVTQSPFGNNAPFSNNVPAQSHFFNNAAPTTQSNVFNNAVPTSQPNIFGNGGTILGTNTTLSQPSLPPPNSHSNSIFGGSGVRPNEIDFSVYSKLEELCQEDIKWFESDNFDIDKIPELPPTYEMCFRT